MKPRITFQTRHSSDVDGVATFLSEAAARLSESPADSETREGAYAIVWGPPAATRDLEAIRASTYRDGKPVFPVIGASSNFTLGNNRTQSTRWLVVYVQSPHILPRASAASLTNTRPKSPTAKKESASGSFIEDFIIRFGEEQRIYFNKGFGINNLRFGAYGVEYNRPAYLLVFLPGIAPEKLDDPHAEVEGYRFIDGLSSQVSRGVPIIGGSAAPGDDCPSWLWTNGSDKVYHNGSIVGLLVETDLTFGYASDHGFTRDKSQIPGHCILVPGAELSQMPDGASPPRGHVIRLPEELERYGSPLSYRLPGKPEPPPLQKDSDVWHTFLTYDSTNESFPCQPYRRANSREYSVLHPLADGAMLYPATTTIERMMQSQRELLDVAKRAGNVQKLRGALVFGCQGRVRLLGSDCVKQDYVNLTEHLTTAWSESNAPVFGMYANGETCPSLRGLNAHRTWSSAVMLFGDNFNHRYAASARRMWLSRIDQRGATQQLKDVFETIVEAVLALTGATSCHIRTISADGHWLQFRHGRGPVSEIVPREVDVSDDAEPSNLTSYVTYMNCKKGKTSPVKHTREEYLREVTTYKNWGKDPLECREAVDKMQWWMCCPIPGPGGQCLGVVSLASDDPHFLDDSRTAEIESIVVELSESAVAPIRFTLMYQSLEQILVALTDVTSPAAVAEAIVQHGGAHLVGQETYLALLLPDDAQEWLCCQEYSGPESQDKEAIRTRIAADSSAIDRGISGWLWQQDKDSLVLNDISWADGTPGRPKHKSCINQSAVAPRIEAQYSFMIRDPETKERLGVLIAEAPHGVLEKEVHALVLEKLAGACGRALSQWSWISFLRGQAELLLPQHIATKLKKGKPESEIFPKPKQSVVTLLFADIRGYTDMCRIVGEGQMQGFIEEYYGLLAGAIWASKGTLDKFMGDGVLAMFGDSEMYDGIEEILKGKDIGAGTGSGAYLAIRAQVIAAVEAGFGMARDFPELAERWLFKWRHQHYQIRDQHRFELGVAIHTGRPLVGAFRTQMDRSNGRVSYTAIGTDVNLVSRVGGEVGDNGVWVTGTAASFLRRSGLYDCDAPLELPPLKGIDGRIQAFRVRRR